MLNEKGEKILEHHVKYLETDGVDETIWITHREHRQLHAQLRKEGKNVSNDVWRAANKRMIKKRYMEMQDKYKRSDNMPTLVKIQKYGNNQQSLVVPKTISGNIAEVMHMQVWINDNGNLEYEPITK